MKATGIVRRTDDLGRIVIPKEIRKTLGIKDGEAMEILINGRDVILRKYDTYEYDEMAENAMKWVEKNKDRIFSVMSYGDKTIVTFKDLAGRYTTEEVIRNCHDKYNMNIAIAFAAKKAGFAVEGF